VPANTSPAGTGPSDAGPADPAGPLPAAHGRAATAPESAPEAAVAASPAGYETLLSAPVANDAADPRIPAPDPAELRPVPAETPATKTFDIPSSRRRPVVFEEDDDLDVPDFLK
jgi:cell division protein FtsZ